MCTLIFILQMMTCNMDGMLSIHLSLMPQTVSVDVRQQK